MSRCSFFLSWHFPQCHYVRFGLRSRIGEDFLSLNIVKGTFSLALLSTFAEWTVQTKQPTSINRPPPPPHHNHQHLYHHVHLHDDYPSPRLYHGCSASGCQRGKFICWAMVYLDGRFHYLRSLFYPSLEKKRKKLPLTLWRKLILTPFPFFLRRQWANQTSFHLLLFL